MRAAEPPQSDRPSQSDRPPLVERPSLVELPGPGVRPGSVRHRPRWLTVAALLSVAAVLVTAGWAGRHDRPVGDRTVGEVTRVGVLPGEAIPGYLRAAATELAALPAGGSPAGTYALVSFADYLAPGPLADALAGVAVVEVVARVPLPGRQTEIVRLAAQRLPQDVVAGMAGVAGRKDREAADQRARAATADDAALRRAYETGAWVAAGEAAAYRAACGCAYAAVVRGVPDALRALAARPAVRAVDPTPELRRLDRTVVTPPLPEQRDVARPPADAGPTPPVGESSEAAPKAIGSSPRVAPAVPGAVLSAVATSPDAPADSRTAVQK
ncbi:hypothetical protein MCAG_01200 [Micromonospora sp. ATCC 39149]|uniref:Uncharacterized protein n=1 Tax=Micromonospora carbonacea TaxID=47853 RepID=A0A7D5Y5E8_9ACTN|nr:hypothetical protein [Micromonospora sp. ATCC 39149]EEP70873.1 hypothetical protein MCAG_01200 [Micromonospora sp. ATCC 39149]QLJ97212.1 hypothetical protein HZU44_20510 [Micromonospora carbonacea]